MKITYLESAQQDIAWFRKYYAAVFPAGKNNASKHYLDAITNLLQNPQIGHAIEGTSARKLVIRRTPFALVYGIFPNEIRIYRLLDGRAKPVE